MTVNVRENLLEIMSSTYPEDIRVIKRKTDVEIFGCVVYANASEYTGEDFEEIDEIVSDNIISKE